MKALVRDVLVAKENNLFTAFVDHTIDRVREAVIANLAAADSNEKAARLAGAIMAVESIRNELNIQIPEETDDA